MYEVSDSLFFGNWNISNPKVLFAKTNEFDGIAEKDLVVVTDGGDFGVHLDETLDIKTCCYKAKTIENLVGCRYWFSTNMNSNLPNHDILPLGLANKDSLTHINGNLENKKEILLYCNFNPDTNREIRPLIRSQIYKLGWAKCEHFQPDERYFFHLSKSYFSVCPPGNGIDSYRIWESLYLGTTPIVLRSHFTERLAQFFPIYIVESYSDITQEKLKQFLNKKQNIEAKRLTRQFWVDRIVELTKSYWEPTPFGDLIKIEVSKVGRKMVKKAVFAKDII